MTARDARGDQTMNETVVPGGRRHSGAASDSGSPDGQNQLVATEQAILNILQDATDERVTVTDTQRAMTNILEDVETEKRRRGDVQKAALNILSDAEEEKLLLGDVQRAALNILDDAETERLNVERINTDLHIRERMRADKAARLASAAMAAANKELEAFSYSVAHDLRAPLRSIDGFSQALVEDCLESLTPAGKTYIGHVRESAQHMARLIDGLLSLSRLSRTELRRTQFDLASVARTVFARLQRDVPDRRVELAVPEEIIVDADARLLEIVFDNLIGNAWKFTSKRVNARIEIGEIVQNEQPVYFVRDNGVGFNMAYSAKLFAVFQRLHTPNEFEGTGIGLANVERIIRLHGGRIWGEGEVGSGAAFYFTIKEGL